MEEKDLQKEKPQSNQNIKRDYLLNPLRTYGDDIKNVVQDGQISSTKILIEEQKKKEAEQKNFDNTSIKSKKNITKILTSILLISIGGGLLVYSFYLYIQNSDDKAVEQIVLEKNDFIEVENQFEIKTDFITGREIVGNARNLIQDRNNLTQNQVAKLKLLETETTTDENGIRIEREIEVSSETFLRRILSSRASDSLIRSLDKEMLLGMHSHAGPNHPFIIFKVSDYEQSFSRMLEWEEFLVDDIRDIFFETLGSSQIFIGENVPERNNDEMFTDEGVNNGTENSNGAEGNETPAENSTDEESTSENLAENGAPEPEPITYNKKDFKDLILSNRDTRAIMASDGSILFFYSFIDRQTLVFATNLRTLEIIIRKINSQRIVR